MKCFLCEKNIDGYNQEFNQLTANDLKTVDVCQECIKKFVKWQQGLFAKLYPTTMAKKWVNKKRTSIQ
jgi:hypothetical protein